MMLPTTGATLNLLAVFGAGPWPVSGCAGTGILRNRCPQDRHNNSPVTSTFPHVGQIAVVIKNLARIRQARGTNSRKAFMNFHLGVRWPDAGLPLLARNLIQMHEALAPPARTPQQEVYRELFGGWKGTTL